MKPFTCQSCSKSYDRRYNLQRHVACTHAADESENDDIDDDHEDGPFRFGDSYVDYYQPGFKERRCQNSGTESHGTELTVDDDDSEESDGELEPEEEGDESSEEEDESSEERRVSP